ncbi:MAG: BatD family protein [Myxococcota bacterium]|nr:BatD family protein [Myxococcota bacterium]
MLQPARQGKRALAAAIFAFLVGLVLVAPARAQEEPRAELKIAPAPYYVGVPIDLHLQVEGLERQPEPRCSAASGDGADLEFTGLSPNITTQVTIINGQTTRTETVSYVCRFSLTVSKPGELRLGPFVASQGGVEVKSPTYAIDVQTIAPDPRVKVRLILPERKVFVGQRMKVGIEWWIAEELQEKVQNYKIRSRLFEMPDRFRFVDDRQPSRGEQTLVIQTEAGDRAFPASVEKRSQRGRSFLVVRTERIAVPRQPGEFDFGRATVTLQEVTRWQRDFFGGRRPAAVLRLFGRDREAHLVVLEAPVENRPPSYGGAIGRGFSFEATADRSVVQRGEPIVLTLTVRGEGGLENVGLPSLEGTLPPHAFNLPRDRPPGELIEGAKIFRVPVRILDESVEEIPALPYSWFDPELGEYQTAYSRPIALSVRPAQLISAEDVVAARPEEPFPPVLAKKPDTAASPEPGRGAFNLTGANLALELDRGKLAPARGSRDLGLAVTYILSLVVLAAAVVYRRRLDRDPKAARVRAACRAQLQRIGDAAALPRKQALGEIASALRELAGLRGGEPGPAWEALVAECDAVFYSPVSALETPLENDLVERARSLAKEFVGAIARSEA